MIFELAHALGVVPLVWLAVLHVTRRRRGFEWWWLAAAYAVSFLADSAAHVSDPVLVSLLYPLSQAALVAAVLLERAQARAVLGGLVGVGLLAVLLRPSGPEWILHSVAWGLIVVVAARRRLGLLSLALVVTFGGSWAAWVAYLIAPGWPTWLALQGARLVGTALWCWAAWRPHPTLRVMR